jgi:hypothetical protein
MQEATAEARQTIGVLSPDYLSSLFTQPEWAAAFAQDPTGSRGGLLLVRVRGCSLEGLLRTIVYIDLVGLNEEDAKRTLLKGAAGGRAKPDVSPTFPGERDHSVEKPERFPGDETGVYMEKHAEYGASSANSSATPYNTMQSRAGVGRGSYFRTPTAFAGPQAPIECEGVKLLVERFLSVFKNHGILTNQIPRFAPPEFNLNISDFRSNETVLNVLSDELLQWAVATFGINREWLDGGADWRGRPTERIYLDFDCYKGVQRFIDVAVRLRRSSWGRSEMFVLKDGELERRPAGEPSYVVMVLREVIGAVNQRPVYRYLPITTVWNWGYWRTRYQAKALFLICEKLSVVTNGYDVNKEDLIKMKEGQLFPEPLLSEMGSYTWHPEDYVDLPGESVRAEEVDESEAVRKYIQEEGYLEYLGRKRDEV